MTLDDVRRLRDLGDANVLALTIWGEARGESVEGKVAVGCVIRNRLQHPVRFGATYTDVCLSPSQFSCWSEAGGRANFAALMAIADAVARGQTVGDPSFRECRFVAAGIIAGDLRDRIGGGTHYVTVGLYDSPKAPQWAKQPHVVQVGSQVFMSA